MSGSATYQGGNSIEKNWLEKPLEFWLDIPYTKKKFKNGMFRHVISTIETESQDLFKAKTQLNCHPVYGTYFLSRPRLVVKDPEVVKHIFVKDFDHFVDRMPAGTG